MTSKLYHVTVKNKNNTEIAQYRLLTTFNTNLKIWNQTNSDISSINNILDIYCSDQLPWQS